MHQAVFCNLYDNLAPVLKIRAPSIGSARCYRAPALLPLLLRSPEQTQMMLPASLLSAAALAMPRTSAPSNATAHGAPEYMGAGAFAQDFHEMTFGASVTASGGTPMQLHMMPDKGLKGAGAVCLDGSDAGFYFAPATNPKNKNDWQLYFQGGGW